MENLTFSFMNVNLILYRVSVKKKIQYIHICIFAIISQFVTLAVGFHCGFVTINHF